MLVLQSSVMGIQKRRGCAEQRRLIPTISVNATMRESCWDFSSGHGRRGTDVVGFREGLAGTSLQSPSLLQGSIASLVLPSAVRAALSLPAQAASPRVSISSPTLCLCKPQEQPWRIFLPPGRNTASFDGLCCKARRVLFGLSEGGIPRLTAFASVLVFQRSHLSPRPQFAAACPCLLTVPPCFKLLILQGTEKTWGHCFVSTC